MCLKWIFFSSAFLKRWEVYDRKNYKGSITGRKYEGRLSLPLWIEKLLWMLVCNFPDMKAYRISAGHLPQTTSTPSEKENAFPDATRLLQASCLAKRIMAFLWACQAPLRGKGERLRYFAIPTIKVQSFQWLQIHFLCLLWPSNLSEHTTADPFSWDILKCFMNLRELRKSSRNLKVGFKSHQLTL